MGALLDGRWSVALMVVCGCAEETMHLDAGVEDAEVVALDAGEVPDASARDGGSDAGSPMIVWSPCPLELGGLESDAECTTLDLPVRWDQPLGRTIPIFLQRFRATAGARTQLWMLQGGPGAAGDGWAPYVRGLSEIDPTIDFYIPDHRGTGRSARLGCVAQEAVGSPGDQNVVDAEWSDCLTDVETTWGADLAGFSSEGAARDLEALIDRTSVDGERVVLFGASYGTTWAHRFLQLFPDRVDGAAFDSMNWPDRSYEDYDRLWDGVAKRVFDACGLDPLCSSQLGVDPWAAMQELHVQLAAGHCAALTQIGLTRSLLSQAVGFMLAYRQLRAPALALVRRVQRCSAQDQTSVVRALNAVFGASGTSDPLFSAVLSEHVLNSEVGRTPTSSTSRAFAHECTICLGAGERPAHAENWPRYDFDPSFLDWADTTTPVLIMNGTLDPFAPADRLIMAGVETAFGAPHQRLIEFPSSAHGSTFESPTTAPDERSCGVLLLLQFAADPEAELDDQCLGRLAPIDFTVSSTLSMSLFGRPDAWEP